MKKLESLKGFESAKLGTEELSKFHGGANNWEFCVVRTGPKTTKIVRDYVGERAVSR